VGNNCTDNNRKTSREFPPPYWAGKDECVFEFDDRLTRSIGFDAHVRESDDGPMSIFDVELDHAVVVFQLRKFAGKRFPEKFVSNVLASRCALVDAKDCFCYNQNCENNNASENVSKMLAFDVPSHHLKLRFDLITRIPEGCSKIEFSVNVKLYQRSYVGICSAQIQHICMSSNNCLNFFDEFSVKCVDPCSGDSVHVDGSMSWKVFDNNFSEEIKFNSVNNNFKVCFSKSRLYELMKSELDSCNFLLSQAKSKEQLCRIELDSLSKDVQSLKKSVKASELSELQSLRSARDATWSNLQTCISNRIDLQERLTNLTKMKECLSIYSTSQSPLSLMCQKCLGTLLISM
jgi:hypothetical protein